MIGLAGASLGLPPSLIGALSGFAVGTFSQVAHNYFTGQALYEGVVERALLGAVSGAASAGIASLFGGIDDLLGRIVVGGMTGGIVSGGMHTALSVAAGRDPREGLRQAIGMGLTIGAVGAVINYYANRIQQRMAQRAEEAALRRRLGADKMLGDGAAPGSTDVLPVEWDAKEQQWRVTEDFEFNNQEYKKGAYVSEEIVIGKAAEEISAGLNRLEEAGWDSKLLNDAREWVDQIASGEKRVLLRGFEDYDAVHREWFGEPGGRHNWGTVNLDTGDVLINRSQVTTGDELLLTIFHEGMHDLDYQNITTLSREMFAYRKTADFAEVVGMKYRALGKGDLVDFLRSEGKDGFKSLVKDVYRLHGHEHKPSHSAVIRHGDMDVAYRDYFVKDILPKLMSIEETGVPLRNQPVMLRFQLKGRPEWLWQYTQHVVGRQIPYDSGFFNEKLSNTRSMQEFLDTLPERFLGLP